MIQINLQTFIFHKVYLRDRGFRLPHYGRCVNMHKTRSIATPETRIKYANADT